MKHISEMHGSQDEIYRLSCWGEHKLSQFILKNLADFRKENETYKEHAVKSQLHLLPPHLDDNVLNAADFAWIYENRLVKGRGRVEYDSILSSAPFGLCPYCFHQAADQLDHFLPKSKFHRFSLSLYNLVPSCGRCNHKKGEKYGETLQTEYLHPYFANLDSKIWLECEVKLQEVVSVKFSSSAFAIGADQAVRVQKQMEDLDVFHIYKTQVAKYLSYRRDKFLQLRKRKNGKENLRSHYKGLLKVELKYPGQNTWLKALLRFMNQSSDFLEYEFIEYIPSPSRSQMWNRTLREKV